MTQANSPARQRRWRLSLGPAAAALLVAYAVWRASAGDADLVGFHDDIQRIWRADELPGAFGIRYYLPAFAVLMIPLMIWPLPISALLVAVVNVVVLEWIVRRCAERFRLPNEIAPFTLTRVWPIVLVLPFAVGTIALGQVNVLVLGLCLLAWERTAGGRRTTAGLAVAVAGVIKLYPLIFVGYWLVRRQWREAIMALASFVVLAGGLSLFAFGWEGTVRAHRHWLDRVRGSERYAGQADTGGGHLLFRSGPSSYLRANNQSLAAVMARWTTGDETAPAMPAEASSPRLGLLDLSPVAAGWLYRVLAVSLLMVLLVQAWRHRAGPPTLAEWSGWLIGVIAFVPIFWTHYFVLLLPPLAWLGVVVWRDRQAGVRWGVAEVLQAAWLAGLPLLAWPMARLAGVHMLLALGVMFWSLGAGARRERALLCRSGPG